MMSGSFQRIRTAVIGGGAFGECHLRTYHSMAHVEVAGLYTLEKDRGKALCRKYGGKSYGSLDALANDASVDLVSIATPEADHFQTFQALAERKKAIYVEKPLATSLDEARRMLALSKSIIAMCGHCLRFESRVAHVFQEREKLGALRHMSFKNRRVRQQKAIYGRVHPACVLLCHEMELANAFAGVPFRRVSAMKTHFSDGQVDGLSALIEYEGGITCVVEGGWLLPTQSCVEENDSVTLDFDAGTYSITLPHAGFTFLSREGHRSINQQYESCLYGMEFGALRSALEYMTRCVAEKRRPQISTIEDGYNAVRLVDAAIRSAATGQWVEREL